MFEIKKQYYIDYIKDEYTTHDLSIFYKKLQNQIYKNIAFHIYLEI